MFIDLLRGRRSIRKFQEQPVEKEKLDTLVEAALRSPSALDRTPWEFVVVRDKQRLKDLSLAKQTGAAFLADAALAIAVCANPEKSDVWTEDASIASLILHLTATDLGLGSCWVQVRRRMHDDRRSAEEYVSKVLGLDEGMVVQAIIAVGYPNETKPGHAESSLQYHKVSFEQYGWKEDVREAR